jgi:hypothetical protein
MPDNTHGVKTGTKIAMLMSQAMVSTHAKLLHIKHKLAMSIFHAISDEISSETQRVLGPYLENLLANPELHPDIRPHIEFLAHEHGQLSALAGTTLAASSILGSIAQITNNFLAPTVGSIIGGSPNLIPDASVLATIMARQGTIGGTDIWAFHYQGIKDDFAQEMIDAARQYPSPADALEMLRRGLISQAEFDLAIRRNAIPEQYLSAWRRMERIPLPVAEAALAVLRGNMTSAEALKVAADAGLSPADFNVLIGNTGEPLALMQLLEAYRRKFIDKATLDKGIKQSRIRDEWIPVAEQLRYSPMSVSDAVNAVVQNHLAQDVAQRYAEENGLDPTAFPTLVETAGEPLSRTEMEQLFNRGLVTQADVEQALRESRLKNKYITDAFKLHVRLLEPRMLSSAVRDGSITKAEGIRKAMEYGYSESDATVLVSQATASKLRTYRERELSAVEVLYENNAISESELTTLAGELGFDADETKAIAAAAEYRREEKVMATAISVARSKYLAHHMTDNDATNYLSAVGIPSAQTQYLINVWSLERTAYVRELTEAQIIRAMKKQVITPEDALTRLTNFGYSDADAKILIEVA